MNEKLRVGTSIVVWCAILLGLVTVAVVYLMGGVATPLTLPRGDNRCVAAANVDTMRLARVSPAEVGLDAAHLEYVDNIVERSIDEGIIPGAVVGVVRGDKLAFVRSYGCREVVGSRVAMSDSTRFDLASLTKPVATATAIMQLVERGEIRLADRVDRYIAGFKGYADVKSPRDTVHIRIIDLMTHTSGLPPYLSTARLQREYEEVVLPAPDSVIDYVANVERRAKPRTECEYSCLNYIALGRIVESVTGESLDLYAREHIFEPLGMSSTRFMPDAEYAAECAPTTVDGDGRMLRGVVHDPLARECMGGVSGNAGLFSTLDDLAVYAAMLLNDGEWRGVRVLSPRSVEALLTAPRGFEEWGRALGWSRCEGYSGVGGDLLSQSAVGHTGATGTSMVIDRELDIAVIVLTNYRHCQERVGVADLRSKIASVVAASLRE